MTEWVWVMLTLWIFVLVYGTVKRDEITRAIGGIMGIVFGILYLSTQFLVSLGMILLNFYILYDAIE